MNSLFTEMAPEIKINKAVKSALYHTNCSTWDRRKSKVIYPGESSFSWLIGINERYTSLHILYWSTPNVKQKEKSIESTVRNEYFAIRPASIQNFGFPICATGEDSVHLDKN